MTPELKKMLESCKNLPSPPGIAARIVALANDPDSDIDKLAEVVALDLAIAVKLVRIANSPMYAQRRRTENVRQALIVLGLNASMSLALSFSLLPLSSIEKQADGLDYLLFWRRSLLCAVVSRALADHLKLRNAEELFLGALIQDIGMLALDSAVKNLYAGLGAEQIHHDKVIAHENRRLGADHAVAGGWLLERWNFPERIQQAVAASHLPDRLPRGNPNGLFARCVVLSSLISEVFLDATPNRRFVELGRAAQTHLGIAKEGLGSLLQEVRNLIPEVEQIFDTQIVVDTNPDAILAEAGEVLMLRNLKAMEAMSTLQTQVESLAARSQELEEYSRRDTLTGLYNRRYLDAFLEQEFRAAQKCRQPLSVAFADLDGFKKVNDTYGHQAGDQILVKTAQVLKANVRSIDMVARYGGEEFVLVFPDTGYELLSEVCERIVRAVREVRHTINDMKSVTVSISVGMATAHPDQEFTSAQDLIDAADKALYRAKVQGRNRSVSFELVSRAKVAHQ
jgi:diguanylate cyclase (GGDEF)-like protein